MNLSCTLHSSARQLSDHPAISWDGGGLSYGEFERQAACMAGALRGRHGLAPGTRVALAMENCPEFLPALYARLAGRPVGGADQQQAACARDGLDHGRLAGRGCASPRPRSPTRCRLPGIGAAAARSSSPARRDYAALLDGDAVAPLPGDPDAEAWMFYTSGTTGRPKGAMLTHRNLLFACHCYYADIDYLGPGDAILHAAPLTHGSGLYGLAHIARGSNNVILPGSFEPERVFDALARYANVSMFAAPTMVARLINHAGGRLGRHARPQDHHLRRRADVCGRPRARARPVRAQALSPVRPGREPDDHQRSRQGLARRHRATRDTRSGSPAPASRAPASPSGSSTRRAASFPPARSARSSPPATA